MHQRQCEAPLRNFGNARSVLALQALAFCNPAVQVSRLRPFLMLIDKASKVTRAHPGADYID